MLLGYSGILAIMYSQCMDCESADVIEMFHCRLALILQCLLTEITHFDTTPRTHTVNDVEKAKNLPPPPYYNIKDTNNSNNSNNGGNNSNSNVNNDGVIVSSEGYSYVTEVPSLPSSQQRHSKKSDFQPSSGATPQGGSGRGGGGGGGGGNDGGVGAPGYENMRPQGGAVGDPGYQNTREPSAFQNHSSHQSSNSSQHRQRRTQRKVTHNEKRYHSGMYETMVTQLLYI